MIFLLVFTNFFFFSCYAQKPNRHIEKQSGYIEIPELTIIDSSIFKVLDYVIENEKENSKYYNSDISFSIGIVFDKKVNFNVIRIEGTDQDIMLIESDGLTGCFKYQTHMFFLIEYTKDYFNISEKTMILEIQKEQEITNDDRFTIYFFGHENGQFFSLIND